MQVHRIGGNDHTFPIEVGERNGRQQIGNALARAGAGLHQQVLALIERLGDGAQHLYLLRAMLKPGKVMGKEAASLKHRGQLDHVQRAGPGGPDQFLVAVLHCGKERAQQVLIVVHLCRQLRGHLLADRAPEGRTRLSPLYIAKDLPQSPVHPSPQAVDLADRGPRQLGSMF